MSWFIEHTQISALTIYVDKIPGLFTSEDVQKFSEMMDSRGGAGFACVEEGSSQLSRVDGLGGDDDFEDGDMDADFVPNWD